MKSKIFFSSLFFCLLFFFTSCFSTVEFFFNKNETDGLLKCDWSYIDGDTIKDLKYGNGSLNNYDLYIPRDRSSYKAKKLILYIHEGAWMYGDKSDGDDWSMYFAKLGYTTASMNYSLLKDGEHPNVLSINEEVVQAVKEIKRYCSEEQGLELDAMALNAFSAGACQALLYGLNTENYHALPLKFIATKSAPTSFSRELWDPVGGCHWLISSFCYADGTDSGWAKCLTQFSGKKVTAEMISKGEDEAVWREISPVTYVSSSSVPLLMIYGKKDRVVPPGSRIVIKEALDKAGKKQGVDYDLIVCEHSGHFLLKDKDKMESYINTLKEYCEKYF